MKTRKTKKRNIIRRVVAFLLCMTMVLGLGMQDVMEQVYAEEASASVQDMNTDTAADSAETDAESKEGGNTDLSLPEVQADMTAASTDGAAAAGTEGTAPAAETAGTEGTVPEAETAGTEGTAPAAETAGTEGTAPEAETAGTEGTAPAAETAGAEGTAPAAETAGTEGTAPETENTDTEAQPEVTDETEAEEEKVTELTYAAEDGSFSVTAKALGEDADLSGYELYAAQIRKDGEEAERYAAAEELLNGALKEESRRLSELQVYDVWFVDTETGEEADLAGQAELSLQYAEPEFPAETDVKKEVFCMNQDAAEAVADADALQAGCELYALTWSVPAGYEGTWENEQVIIHVTAEDGVVPEGAELSVTPIVKTEITEDMSEEEKAAAEELNAQYDETEQKLTEDLEAKAQDEQSAAVLSADSADAEDAEENTAAQKTLEGFLAFDICFLVDGEEVEPDGEVQVSFEFSEAVIPEGVSEDAEVSVAHLKKDDSAEDGIVVEDMTASETATVETTETAAVTKVELTTDSFSTFAITWQYGNWWETFDITAHYMYINENGKLEEFSEDTVSHTNVTLTAGKEYELLQWKADVSGYKFVKVTTEEDADADAVTRIQTGFESWFGTNYYYVKMQKEGELDYENWLSTNYYYGGTTSGDLYYIYQQTGVRIEDDIMNSGALNAVYTGEGKPVSYTWYKSDTEEGLENEEAVDKITYQNGASNLSEDGSSLYPAYDSGARHWYKVEVTLEDGTTVTSSPFQVPYYDELQNGSFEEVPVPNEYNNMSNNNMQYGNDEYKNEGGVWQSTGETYSDYYQKNVAIEIVHEGWYDHNQGNGYSWYVGWENAAPDGEQFAELNCQAAGALYQDVLTMEGTSLNYWLQHRARGYSADGNPEYDTMYLVIMPTSIAVNKELETQESLRDYLDSLGIDITNKYNSVGNNVVDNKDGILVVRVTSDDQDWQYVYGTNYVPTSSLTRFFFVAGRTAADGNSDKPTQGNFLDAVGFSQELPPVADDEFTLQIEKKFVGLDDTGIKAVKEKIQFTVTAVDAKGQALSDEDVAKLLGRNSNVISGSEMTSAPDGTLSFLIANKKIGINDSYTFTVTEQNADLEGYKSTAESEAVITVADKTGEPVTGTDSISFAIQGKTTAVAVFTNTYDRSEKKTVSFTKKWDDANNEFGTRPESLNVKLQASITVEENGVLTEKALNSADLGGIELTKTLTAADWSTSWTVPVYYNYNGAKVKIDYTVEEGTVNSSYVYEAIAEEALPGDGSDYEDTFNANKVTEAQNLADINSLLRTSALYSGILSTARSGDGNDGDTLGTPAHRKYIEYNRNTGDYTLNLDVTGAQGEASGVDILFVIDTSGSMGAWPGGWNVDREDYHNILPNVKELLTEDNGIIDQIFSSDGNVNSVAYVSFAGKSETKSSGWYQTSTKESLKNSIESLQATGGTNWTYAMQRASSLLAQRENSGNEKVVIFLSDGTPTYTMYGNRQTGNGNTTNSSYYTDAASVVTSSDSLKNAKFYSVYLTSDTKDGMETFDEKLTSVDSELVDGTELSEALSGILKTIIPTYQNVVITDTLSDYVDFVDRAVTVKAEAADGTVKVLAQGTDYTLEISGKTVTVNLLKGNSLASGTTYTVSFKVKPSEKANTEYAESGYPNGVVGETGTGVTSEGQSGFCSNTKATVSYEVNETPGEAGYAMPVVQVTTHTLTYTKTWNQPGSISEPTQDVKLLVSYTDGTSKVITLTAGNNYTYTESVPVTKMISTVTEQNCPGNYTPSYEISEDRCSVTVINNYSMIEKQDITVEKVWSENGEKTPIQVVLLQSKNGEEATVVDRVKLSEDEGWTHTWKEAVITEYEGQEATANYTYAVREVNTPAGYSSSISYSYKNGITAVITNTYDSNCADEAYYMANVLQTEKLKVTKVWDDNDNILKLRPNILQITVNDGVGGSYVVDLKADNSWQKTLTILKKAERTFSAKEHLQNTSYYKQSEDGYSVTETADGAEISFVNELQSKDIVVKKVWRDGTDYTYRPETISFKLQYRTSSKEDWQDYDTYSLTEENILYENGNAVPWAMKITALPINYKYQIVEVNTAENYSSSVTDNDGTFTITNTLKWSLKKTNLPAQGEGEKLLAGAEFVLKDGTGVEGVEIATGTSGADGFISWKSSGNLEGLNGTYTLQETKAPNGYQLLQAKWTLTFDNGLLIRADAPAGSNYGTFISMDTKSDKGIVVTVKNDELYELPSTGGPGVYLYMLSGTLLMMAGALLVYKKRKEEVLRS